jgi:hypothetical protein
MHSAENTDSEFAHSERLFQERMAAVLVDEVLVSLHIYRSGIFSVLKVVIIISKQDMAIVNVKCQVTQLSLGQIHNVANAQVS